MAHQSLARLAALAFFLLLSIVDAGHAPRSNVITKAPQWAKNIKHSIGHQNPAKAPPVPNEDLELSEESQTSLEQYYEDSSNSSTITIADRSLLGRSLEKRGPLYCKDGPCADGSCCGPEGICGYGPDFCGKGCQSQCDATAMCGEYSEDGDVPCGMNLCCSSSGWCGTTEVFCHNADPQHGTLPCQAGYGSCSIASTPYCGKGSGSTGGRTIGYYQSWNVRNRKCDTKTPKQLNTKGYTHLFYSFAFIDPNSFALVPAHDDDPKQMREFTSLAKKGLKTWIAVGGFDFSNEDTATHTTWSDMVSTKQNRAAFIASARAYMDEYGFTGIDLDWEYPGEPKRGGRKMEDTRNFSLLLKEMREAYGTKYGISLTLAPDYWYLRWFDAKAMEPYVDFFGFMAYDLHGYWDEDVKTLGKIIRGQADIREIGNNTVPLWFAGLDPKKINFGLAMYGRGYTVSDPKCNTLGCSFAGPSKKGKCSDSDGVMSLSEVQDLIKEKGLKPNYLRDSLMKELTWDDQWIGYDDEETMTAKKAWADGQCFGGSMVWSIDFQPGSGGGDGGDDDTGNGGGNDDDDDDDNTGEDAGKIPEKLWKKKLPNCKTGWSFDDIPDDGGQWWYDTGAEQWANEYLNGYIERKGSSDNWAQSLYRNLFPTKSHTDFSCERVGSACSLGTAECKHFNDIDKGGLYYLFLSMVNFHIYMKELDDQFKSSVLLTSLEIGQIRKDLGIPSGSPEEQGTDVLAIIGAAFTIGSGLELGLSRNGGGDDDSDEAKDSMEHLLAGAFKAGREKITDTVGGVFGAKGVSQLKIPEGMRDTSGPINNGAIKVFAYGSYLVDQPLDDLADVFETMSKNLQRGVLWQMAKDFRGYYAVVRDDKYPKSVCDTGVNLAWDADRDRCLDILAWYPKEVDMTLGGNQPLEKIWDKYDMDKLDVIRNAINCWEDNDGKIPTQPLKGNKDWTSKKAPPCFYALPSMRGKRDDRWMGVMTLNKDFPNQGDQGGKIWPRGKCEIKMDHSDCSTLDNELQRPK